MIKHLELTNFKAFEHEEFVFGNLNVLSGLNNSGKSTVLQAIRIVSRLDAPPEMMLTDFIRGDMSEFRIDCCYGKNNSGLTNVTLSYNRKKHGLGVRKSMKNPIFVSYISADRFGPRTSLPLSKEGYVETVGSNGEYIVDFLEELSGRWAGLKVPHALLKGEGQGLMWNIKEWLRSISPGVDFGYHIDRMAEIGRTEFNEHKSIHTGFGLSYALPIIASILVHAAQTANDSKARILLIENPEAHLHPSGQTMMGRMLAKGAFSGLQIFVETHSDHLLNGIRIAIRTGDLPPDDVKGFYFSESDNEMDEASIVNRITIDKHGMLDHWPEGFFDETEKNLLQLL